MFRNGVYQWKKAKIYIFRFAKGKFFVKVGMDRGVSRKKIIAE